MIFQDETMDRRPTLAVIGCLACIAIAVVVLRFSFVRGDDLFWDARVFERAGMMLARGENPYLGLVGTTPYPLSFVTAPQVARILAAIGGVIGPSLFWVLALAHFASLALSPIILARLFIGQDRADAGLGHALLFAGLGAWGVPMAMSANFASTIYLLIFGALLPGVRNNRWMWFHIAVAIGCQIKPPFALFWALPVMLNGWSWRLLGQSAAAAACAALPYVAAAILDPVLYADWLAALGRQVAETGDVGLSLYGAVYSLVGRDVGSPLAVGAHLLFAAGLFAFLLFNPVRGPRRLAALILLAIVANPRMKEYDLAFAAIPATALGLSLIWSGDLNGRRRALAMLVGAAALLAACAGAPKIGKLVFFIVPAAAIFTLMRPASLPLETTRRGQGPKTVAAPV